MRYMSGINRSLRLAALLLAAVACAQAQPSDTITANPKAVRLRRIWSLAGNPAGGGYVGQGCGGVGDLDGDGLSEFAVLTYGKWKIYRGASPAPDTSAIWQLDSCSSDIPHPIVGDFFGTGHRSVGFARSTCNDSNGICLLQVWLFDIEGNTLSKTPRAIIDTKIQFCARSVVAGDLNHDGADELLMARACSFPEVWIYQGGGAFNPDVPTFKVIDQERTSNGVFSASVGDIDGDGDVDLVTSGIYSDGAKLKFYWGSDSSFWRWKQPDRVITFSGDDYPRLGYSPAAGDFDGDHVLDLAFASPDGPRLFRSGGGRNARTRSYRNDDADMHWKEDIQPVNLGYLNDTTHRYAMLGVIGSKLYGFAGGPYGPDRIYEAYYSALEDGYNGTPFIEMSPMGDCTGDGWPEFITSNGYYGFNAGVVLILAGGPEIPRDVSLGVEVVAGEGHSDAVSIWPNPLSEELHIAWRGDLRRMPRRFAVHDLAGREVARGEVESWRGEALWQCAGVASGAYVLTVYDASGSVITSARLVKV